MNDERDCETERRTKNTGILGDWSVEPVTLRGQGSRRPSDNSEITYINCETKRRIKKIYTGLVGYWSVEPVTVRVRAYRQLSDNE